MRRNEDEKRGWILVAAFLLIGLLCVILTGNLAIRLAPTWSLNADMRSRLNPDIIYTTRPTHYVLQPLDPAILTPPIWINVFLTPGQTFPTRLPKPTAVPTEIISPTQIPPTIPPTALPTSTPIYWPVPATQTPYPEYTKTSKPPAVIATSTSGSAATATPIPTTASGTPTSSTGAAPTPTPSNSPTPSADLQVTITDGVLFYSPGGTLTYTVVVSNNGPDNASGAQVSAAFPLGQVASWLWTCVSQNNGASGCDPAGNTNSTFADSVNLPTGGSITYLVMANIRGNPSGSLSTTVSIKEPVIVLDPAQGNNSATDTDEQVNTLPHMGIGPAPDGITYFLPSGSSVTLAFNTPLVVGGHSSWDLVFNELPNGSGIAMDWIIVQVGDGSNWYTIFNWGDSNADTNSNLDINVIGGTEDDNRDFSTPPASYDLYPFDTNPGSVNTGIVLDLDGVAPSGTYPYVRFIAPSGDLDGGTEIDAVSILP